ncbi:MAG: undecaprenyl-diphosphate phosphatase [Terriglobia bacterium]
MTLLQTIVLAVVQGLTEFLPISSTAHLVLVPWFAGWQDPGLTFNVALHVGTLLSVLVYFARTWRGMLRGFFGGGTTPEARPGLFALIAFATVPGALAGYFLEAYAENVFRSPVLIASALIVVSLLLWVADRRHTLVRQVESIGWADALLIGLAQAVAIIPGTSRAGITIAAGLFCNLTREAAARFSFMLATPIIAGAAVKRGLELWQHGFPAGTSTADFALGVLVSAAVGYAAIAFLLRYLRAQTLKIFIAYRLALGGIILVVEFLHSYP